MEGKHDETPDIIITHSRLARGVNMNAESHVIIVGDPDDWSTFEQDVGRGWRKGGIAKLHVTMLTSKACNLDVLIGNLQQV